MWTTSTLDAITSYNTASWDNVKSIYETNVALDSYSKKMAYNYAGRLGVGCSGLTTEQMKSQFSLWTIMMSPLEIGCDVSKMTDE